MLTSRNARDSRQTETTQLGWADKQEWARLRRRGQHLEKLGRKAQLRGEGSKE